MNTSGHLAAFFCACLIGGSTAHARPANYSTKEERAILRDFAGCIADKHPVVVRRLIGVASPDEAKGEFDSAKLGDPACIPKAVRREFVSMSVSGYGMKFAVAEVLFQRDMRALEPEFVSVPLLNHGRPPSVSDFRDGGDITRAQFMENMAASREGWIISRLGECVSREDPKGSRAVLLTDEASDAETAALSALVPVLSRCLSGGSIRIKPDKLRGTIALNHFRMHMAKLSAVGSQ